MKPFAQLSSILLVLAASQLGCSEASSEATTNTAAGGGTTSVGGTQTGGTVNQATGGATGGSPTGGTQSTAQGGTSIGGTTGTGATSNTGGAGLSTGGSGTGGKASGGTTSTGGISSTGGQQSVGGAATGGKAATGGRSTGGASNGGTSTGGASTGGANTGGATVATGGASASGGSTAAYNPCPTNGDPCKILPFGDSITWGVGYEGAYRVELFSKAVAAQQKIMFTGSQSNGPTTVSGVAFPRSNEGHSGFTIDGIAALVPSPAFTTIPHIVLLMIGTNDVYASSGQATMSNRLGSLIDKIILAAPNALLVVAKITPLNNASWNATIKTYNDAIPALVQARVAAGKHVMLGDMNTGFTSSMLSTDTIHPNQSGYNFMGDQWYALIGSLLPK